MGISFTGISASIESNSRTNTTDFFIFTYRHAIGSES